MSQNVLVKIFDQRVKRVTERAPMVHYKVPTLVKSTSETKFNLPMTCWGETQFYLKCFNKKLVHQSISFSDTLYSVSTHVFGFWTMRRQVAGLSRTHSCTVS